MTMIRTRTVPIAAAAVVLWVCLTAPASAADRESRPTGNRPARVAAATAGPTTSPRAGARPRRLEDIPIEGDVAMPQVLFISGRDQRRIASFQHRRFLSDARTIGERTVLPSRLALAATSAPAAAGGGEAR